MNPDPLSPPVTNFSNKISPSILLIIVILAVIFFLSALLHLLARYLLRPSSAPSSAAATAVQDQLRHLFHLHDAGVDQSSIDALPVFLYQSLAGLRRENPFDCAVCLSEFQPADELRLLPGCSHAFHLPCIDTWLLAHSTCPLCRRSLIPDVLDSGGEIGLDVGDSGRNQNLGFVEGDGNFIPNSILDDPKEESEAVDSKLVRVKLETFNNLDATENGGEVVGTSLNINSNINLDQRRCFSMGYYEYVMDETSTKNPPSSKKNTNEKCEAVDSIVVQVKLGTFRNLDATEIGEGTSDSNINFDQMRCFSMGSYEYVMDDASILRVAIEPLSSKKKKLAMSECDCHSKREGFKSFDLPPLPPPSQPTTSSFGVKLQQRESFSFSKIWLRTSKENPKSGDSSRRAASFRLQSELDIDLEAGSYNGSIGSSAEEAPSLVRRTLMWIVGRQNKVGNHG